MPYTYTYPRPAVTVDIVVFRSNLTEVLLIRRLNPPFENTWAIPGGFVDMNETLEQAAARELEEETDLKEILLRQFHAFSEPNRDPRHRTISIAFYGFVENDQGDAIAGSDAKDARWFKTNELPSLAFDHDKILAKASEAAKKDLSKS